MSFGKMPIANNFLDKKNFNNEYFFDMEVAFNEEKSLLHLKNFPKPQCAVSIFTGIMSC